MKVIQVDFYKTTGKWYTEGTLELPNEVNLFDDGIQQMLYDLASKKIVAHPEQFFMVTRYISEGSEDNFFFDRLFIPKK